MTAGAKPDDREPAFQSPVLTPTKVHLSPTPPPVVERRTLLEALAASAETPVVLVSAPPGYGKTTLLGQWRERERRPFAYVRLDDADNDPVVMLAYILFALEAIGCVGERVKEALRTPHPALGREVLPGVAHEIADREAFVLVLDDVHAIHSEASLDTLAYLAGNVPEGSQLVLSGRSDPAIPLACHKAGRSLVEMRADRLAFDETEAAQLFAALAVGLDGDGVRQLVRHTEGWPAGLYLAALYLRGRDDPGEYVARFRGDHRSVSDYFITEVLAPQSDEVARFLRRTSILERLSGPLCDSVLRRQGSAALLAEMERSIPFLVPLDERREWYRYHTLFGEMLARELESLEQDDIPELHRRAAEWYESQVPAHDVAEAVPLSEGDAGGEPPAYLESAVRHARAGGDDAHAADLLARDWRRYAADGALEPVRRMLDGFDAAQVAAHPPLSLTAAWVAFLLGDAEGTREALAYAAPLERSERPGWPAFRSSLELLRAGLGDGGVPDVGEHSRLAYDLESSSPSAWFGMSRVSAGAAALLEGDRDGAARLLDGARARGREYRDERMLSEALLAVCDIDDGDWDAARIRTERAYECAGAGALAASAGGRLARAARARVLAHDGKRAGARRVLDDPAPLTDAAGVHWWLASLALLTAVEAYLDAEDPAGAERSVSAARALVLSRERTGSLGARLARAQAAVGQRLLPEPLSASEIHVFEQLPSEASLSEIGESIFLSRNTVKTHVRSIYRKLGVASRTEAVDLGRSLGLID